MAAEPTAEEQAVVDAVLGQPSQAWNGRGAPSGDLRVAERGFHRAESVRHLLLPALHALQNGVGYISEGGLNYVCYRLDVPPADAYGVASFYALLATHEQPRRVAHVCTDIACRRTGAMALLAASSAAHASPCLGQCDRAPAVFVQRAGETNLVIAPATGVDGERSVTPPFAVGGDLRLLRRVGTVDPASLDAYQKSGGYRALARALEMGAASVVEHVKASRIRGRGGAAFPMGVKWEAVASSAEPVRYLVCNADESEPGTFKDRTLMEGDPFALVESMTITGFAIGATLGYLYIRAEYPQAEAACRHAIDTAHDAGLLGDDILGSGVSFDIEIRMGGGAYICGEETALFNSIEGYRGEPRQKPPFPTQAGLFGKPTVVNNVETLMNVPLIVLEGGERFAAIGTEESTGPKLFCVSGDVARPGLYEVDFGATLRDVIDLAGGAETMRAVLLGGAAGSFVGPEALDLPLTFEATRAAGAALGSGVVMVFDDTTDFADTLHRMAAFFRDESCGQCVPCRVGTVRQEEALQRIASGATLGTVQDEIRLLGEVDQVMRDASICGLGHTAGVAVHSAIRMGLIG